jgi:hypothetical protein
VARYLTGLANFYELDPEVAGPAAKCALLKLVRDPTFQIGAMVVTRASVKKLVP